MPGIQSQAVQMSCWVPLAETYHLLWIQEIEQHRKPSISSTWFIIKAHKRSPFDARLEKGLIGQTASSSWLRVIFKIIWCLHQTCAYAYFYLNGSFITWTCHSISYIYIKNSFLIGCIYVCHKYGWSLTYSSWILCRWWSCHDLNYCYFYLMTPTVHKWLNLNQLTLSIL